jgi:hypothetical protein
MGDEKLLVSQLTGRSGLESSELTEDVIIRASKYSNFDGVFYSLSVLQDRVVIFYQDNIETLEDLNRFWDKMQELHFGIVKSPLRLNDFK